MKNILDKTDRKILTLLQSDASISMDSLADSVSLSRNACWRRVKQMEENGVIKSRVTLIDPDAIGLGLSVFVMIKISDHATEWLKKFEQAVRSLPEILGAHRMSGDLDYVLRVRVADVKGYDLFYKRLISQVPVSDISASFVMEDIKETTELPLEQL